MGSHIGMSNRLQRPALRTAAEPERLTANEESTHEVTMELKPISTIRLLWYGFLTWLIPFCVSLPLIGGDGQPILPSGTFKSLMIVVGSVVGA